MNSHGFHLLKNNNTLLFINKSIGFDMNKQPNRLPKMLHGAFALFEALAIAAAFGLCLVAVINPASEGNIQWQLPPVGLAPETGALAVRSNPPSREAITVQDLRGSIVIQNPDPAG